MSEPIIKVDNLRKVYKLGTQKVVALDNINLEIYPGEICCILGTSGSGKSTLLNMLAGLEKPSRGNVFINNSSISQMSEKELVDFRQKYLGFVFQSYNLINSMTALENVTLPLVFKGKNKNFRVKAAKNILKTVGLSSHLNHKPSQMSGGQQQRVGIARAFVSNPSVVFADEPTGNLDSKTTDEIMKIMLDVAQSFGQTLVIVTHDRDIASYANRIFYLFDGRICYDLHVNKELYGNREDLLHHIQEIFDTEKQKISQSKENSEVE
ncbi:MAG: ABC transporter ATP-binding protein [Clostridia bacterium]|nr:ABC transporter ATP-binding protein [Clostridia bacterium]